MLAIRLQRLGRKAMPIYRVAVQEAQRHPTSGRVIAYVGTYNPHTKATTFDQEKVAYYLKNGAQPTPRVVRLLKSEKIALPAWVADVRTDGKKTIRNAEKLRRNRAPEPVPVEVEEPEAPAEEPASEEPETPSEEA